MIRAVIDINVLISAFILARGLPYQILTAWRDGRYALVSSEGMLRELAGKLRSPRLVRPYNLMHQDIGAYLVLLRTQAELTLVPADELRSVTGDPEDDLVLATGRLAQAHYLVTGDKGLLERGQYEGTQILTPREFLSLLAQSQGRQ